MSYVHNIKYFLPLWPWRLFWKLEAQCLFEQGLSITRICLSAAQRKFCLADVFQLRMKRLLPAHAESFISKGLRCCELLRDCFSGTPSVKIIRGSRFMQSAIAGPKSLLGSSKRRGTRSKPLGQEISGLQHFRERGLRDSINTYVGSNVWKMKLQIKSRQMKYNHKDWIKPLESLGRFKSSLLLKRGRFIFSSVFASPNSMPQGTERALDAC